MFTRNFDQLLISQLITYSSGTYTALGSDGFGDDKLSFKTFSGTPYYISTYPTTWLLASSSTNVVNSISVQSTSLVFGTDGTPESYDDYCVVPATNIEVKLLSNQTGILNGKPCAVNCRVIKNTSQSTITIRELGLVTAFNARVGNMSTSATRALLFRKVLDEPIVLGAGELVEVTLKIELERLNKPNVSVVVNNEV